MHVLLKNMTLYTDMLLIVTQFGSAFPGLHFWHCSHSMQQGLCNVTVSVRLPVCPSYRLLQQRAANLLLWIAGQEISIDCCTAGAQQQWRTAARRSAAKASSVAVYSCRRRLNTGLVFVISDLHFSLSATCFVLCEHWLEFENKKLSYRRGTARGVVSVEILPIATQQCRNYLYEKSWRNRSYEVEGLRWADV